ncbi:uncharacterized protein [Oscarella lobularis]|uniref:uncharacterized protein n=1 Tax=Oscarella lobularis TaxID=121494 RepID=UPI0033140EC6
MFPQLVYVSSFAFLVVAAAVERHELQARCAARCLVYTPDTPRGHFGTGPYGAGPYFGECIEPCLDVPTKSKCMQECEAKFDANQGNCTSTCLFLDQIRSDDASSGTPKKRLPTKVVNAPSFDRRTLMLSWNVDIATLYADSSYAKYGVSFVVQFVDVTRLQSTNSTYLKGLTWTSYYPTFFAGVNVTEIVLAPNAARLYVFRVGVYNQFGGRGFSNAWSAPLNLSLYYKAGDIYTTDKPSYCEGVPGQYPEKPSNMQHGNMELVKGSVSVNITWDPPVSGVQPSCYEIFVSNCNDCGSSLFLPASATEHRLTGLQLGRAYTVHVISYPVKDIDSPAVDTTIIRAECSDSMCPKENFLPQNLTVTYAVVSGDEEFAANVSWQTPVVDYDVSKYELWYFRESVNNVNKPISINTNESVNGWYVKSVKELSPKGSYSFEVRVLSSDGHVKAKAEQKIRLPLIWTLVEKVDLQAVEKNIRVAWYVSKGYYELEGFQISWWEASANRTANSISLRPSTRRYLLTDLLPDTDYYVAVRANSDGAHDEEINFFTSPSARDGGTGSGSSGSSSTVAIIIAVISVVLVIVIVASILLICHRRRTEKKAAIASSTFPTSLGLTADGQFPRRQPFTPKCRPDDWEVDPSRIRILELLGEGFFGVVVKAEVVSRSMSTAAAQIEMQPSLQAAPTEQMQVHLPISEQQRLRVSSTRGLLNSSASSVTAATAHFTVPRTLVAIKMLKDASNEEEQRDLYAEIAMMKRIGSHRHIVSILGSVTQSLPLMLIIEYVPNGDLLTFLRKSRSASSVTESAGTLMNEYSREPKPGFHNEVKRLQEIPDADDDGDGDDDDVFTCKDKPSPGPYVVVDAAGASLTPLELVTFGRQIALGIEYLHSRGVVHRDLACRNVLVGDNRQLKVSDFGLARAIYQDKYVTSKRGFLPFKWMSIEAILDRTFTPESDVWSFGVVLWEIFTLGGHPYPAVADDQLVDCLKAGYRMDKPHSRCPDEIYELMKRCWQPERRDRPTMSHLIDRLNHAIRVQATSKRSRSYSNRTNNPWLSVSDLDSEEPTSRSASVS